MKKKLLIVLTGAALTLGLGACGSKDKEESKSNDTKQSETKQTASSSDGEKIFQQSCASCHGSDLRGVVGPSLQKVGGKYKKEDIENIIAKGRGAMPAGVVKGDDASKVAEWLSEKK